MATKKPKSSSKSTTKSKTTKPKTAAKTAEKTVVEAPKTNTVEKKSNKSFLSGFFAKKYEGTEGIMTVFKDRKFYGALLGEVIGTMLLSLLIFAISMMGVANIAAYAFALIAIFVAVFMFSGASLNPLVTVGLMSTRRVSVIRGIMYIIAEIIGAWLGWMIFNAFHLAGGETAYDVPAMSAIAEDGFWMVAMVEFIGSTIFAFFVSRALDYKRSVFTFAATIAGGLVLAILVGYVISAAFLGLSSNFAYNPAIALMLQIFPTAGESFGEVLGGICQALSVYVLFPCIGGVLGFYLSDFMKKLSED